MQVPFSPPDIREEDIEAVVNVLRSGWITTGKVTKAFEAALTEYTGAACTICLNSATAALEAALRLLGVGPGDEVITSAYTYTASASVIAHVGATPVLVDCLKDCPLIDPEEVAKAITSKTKVIIPVDIAGIPCDYDAIYAILEAKKSLFSPANDLQKAFGRVIILADAAHSLGAVSHDVKSGALADFTSFSFHAIKNLTTAEGGALCWRKHPLLENQEIYKNLCLLTLHGQTKDALKKEQPGNWEYDIMLPGYKCNMTDIAAALGLSQLKRYDQMLAYRRELLNRYATGLQNSKVWLQPHNGSETVSSGHLALTRVIGATEQQRNQIIQTMGQAGASANVHYKPLPLLTAYKKMGFSVSDFPHAWAYYQNELTLPLYTTLSLEQQDFEMEQLLDAVAKVMG